MTAGRQVRCETCQAVIQSMHRHDFRWCDCPADSDTKIFVDGGSDYTRMGFGSAARWTHLD